MTREEAIEVLTNLQNGHGVSYSESYGLCFGRTWMQAYEMAIAALREQEERNKGCEYCTPKQGAYGYRFGKDFSRDGGNIAACIRWSADGEDTLHLEAFDIDGTTETVRDFSDTPIRCCPICGRRLEEV